MVSNMYSPTDDVAKYSHIDSSLNALVLGDGELATLELTSNEDFCDVDINSITFKRVGETDENISFFKQEENYANAKKNESPININNNKFKNSDYLPNEHLYENGTCSSTNKITFDIAHKYDYGSYFYKNGNTEGQIYNYFGLFTYLNDSSYVSDSVKQQTIDLYNNQPNENRAIYFNLLSTNATAETHKNGVTIASGYIGDIVINYINYSKNKNDEFKIPVYLDIHNCSCVRILDSNNVLSEGDYRYDFSSF